jgi:hypothetical protein
MIRERIPIGSASQSPVVRVGWAAGGGAVAAVFCVVDFFVEARAPFVAAAFTFFAETAAGPWKRSGIQ